MKAGKPNRMTIGSLLTRARRELAATSDSPGLDAEIILAHVLGKPKIFLYTHAEHELTKLQYTSVLKSIQRRKKGEPIAYILGYKEFFGLRFKVNRHVLIPRPETEGLVELVLDAIREDSLLARRESSRAIKILDAGTGSGCIVISLAKTLAGKKEAHYKFFASDVSKRTLAVARANAKFHKVKIKFAHSHLLREIKSVFDILIANLPYGWEAWKNNTTAQTRGLKFEPRAALFTDEFGLGLYRQLFQQIALRKTPPLHTFLEFDPRQKTRLKNLIKLHLPAASLEFHKDLAGNWRFAHISILRSLEGFDNPSKFLR